MSTQAKYQDVCVDISRRLGQVADVRSDPDIRLPRRGTKLLGKHRDRGGPPPARILVSAFDQLPLMQSYLTKARLLAGERTSYYALLFLYNRL